MKMKDLFINIMGVLIVAAIVSLGVTGVVWLIAFLFANMPK